MTFEFDYTLGDGRQVTVEAHMNPPESDVGLDGWYGEVYAFDERGNQIELSNEQFDLLHYEASKRALEKEADWD